MHVLRIYIIVISNLFHETFKVITWFQNRRDQNWKPPSRNESATKIQAPSVKAVNLSAICADSSPAPQGRRKKNNPIRYFIPAKAHNHPPSTLPH